MSFYKAIPREILTELYFAKGMSHKAIAAHLGISEPTVRARFRESGLIARERGSWQIKYTKTPFSGSESEKAYMLGFRVGDLSVHARSASSRIIIARTNTTDDCQVQLLRSLFGHYGGVSVSKKKAKSINCYLDRSFSFLLVTKPYNVEAWIAKSTENCLAFMAGYIDAEGNFILNQGKARFKLDSYDEPILEWMYHWLSREGIRARLRLIANKGASSYMGGYWNGNLWRLNINEAHSLDSFCRAVLPYLRHQKRIGDVKICLSNILLRKINGTI